MYNLLVGDTKHVFPPKNVPGERLGGAPLFFLPPSFSHHASPPISTLHGRTGPKLGHGSSTACAVRRSALAIPRPARLREGIKEKKSVGANALWLQRVPRYQITFEAPVCVVLLTNQPTNLKSHQSCQMRLCVGRGAPYGRYYLLGRHACRMASTQDAISGWSLVVALPVLASYHYQGQNTTLHASFLFLCLPLLSFPPTTYIFLHSFFFIRLDFSSSSSPLPSFLHYLGRYTR